MSRNLDLFAFDQLWPEGDVQKMTPDKKLTPTERDLAEVATIEEGP